MTRFVVVESSTVKVSQVRGVGKVYTYALPRLVRSLHGQHVFGKEDLSDSQVVQEVCNDNPVSQLLFVT